jgi:DnaJ-class molecular chaperone
MKHKLVLTNQALAAMLSGDPLCPTCNGRGRDQQRLHCITCDGVGTTVEYWRTFNPTYAQASKGDY